MFQIIEQHSLSQSRKAIVLTILAAIFIPMGFVAVGFTKLPSFIPQIYTIDLADRFDSHSLE